MNKAEFDCPRCGGSFSCENGLDEYTCPYCGNRVVVDMPASKLGVKAAFGLLSRRQELKAEQKRAEIEAKEREAERKAEEERVKFKRGILVGAALVILLALMFAVGIVFESGDDNADEETAEASASAGPSSAASPQESASATNPSDASANHADGASSTQPAYLTVTKDNQADITEGDAISVRGKFYLKEADEAEPSNIEHDGKSYYISVTQPTLKNPYDFFETRIYTLSEEGLELLSQYEDDYFRHIEFPDSKEFTATIQGTASERLSRGALAEKDPAYSELQGWVLADGDLVDIATK